MHGLPQIRAAYEQPEESFFVSAAGVVLTFQLGEGLHLTKEIPAPQFEKLVAAYGKKLYEEQEKRIQQEENTLLFDDDPHATIKFDLEDIGLQPTTRMPVVKPPTQ